MLYMPDPTPDGRLPEREYFWNVLEISEEWWQKLNALPFVSQNRGKTLHLLKKQSKAVP